MTCRRLRRRFLWSWAERPSCRIIRPADVARRAIGYVDQFTAIGWRIGRGVSNNQIDDDQRLKVNNSGSHYSVPTARTSQYVSAEL